MDEQERYNLQLEMSALQEKSSLVDSLKVETRTHGSPSSLASSISELEFYLEMEKSIKRKLPLLWWR